MAAIMILLLLAFMSIFIILELVGRWQVYRKMGIAPWKCLIPYYSTYVAYRAVWSVQFFWAWLVLALLDGFLPSPFALELRIFVRLGRQNSPNTSVKNANAQKQFRQFLPNSPIPGGENPSGKPPAGRSRIAPKR